MWKTFDGINTGFETMRKNNRQRLRFEKEQKKTSRNKNIISEVKAQMNPL